MAAMAAIAAIATGVSGALQAAGTIAAGKASAQQGQLAQFAANYEAKQLDIKAKDEKASAQREMLELRREKESTLGRLQTVAAGSGFSATDPSTLSIADEISRYGTYREGLALYGGDVRSQDMKLAAAGRRFEGARALQSGLAAKKASYLSAAGTIAGTISSMASKFAPAGGGFGTPSGGGYRYG